MSSIVEQLMNTLSETAREGITEMVDGGLAAGAPLPCPRHVAIDLATHAAEQCIRTIKEHSFRAGREGEGVDMIVMLLVSNYLYSSLDILRKSFAEGMLKKMSEGMRQ